MPQLRSLLGRKPVVADSDNNDNNENTQTRLSLDSQRNSGPLKFRKSREEVPNEYKLSVVNDSGVYLPPSPPEKPGFWHRYSHSPASSNHRDLVNENEPFSISRESFDSYRRSFDISARSPVAQTENIPPRTSLDSRFPRHNGRLAPGSTFEKPQSMQEEAFEDVGLADEDVKPKKKGLFARFGDNNSSEANGNNNRPASSHLGFRLPGRKRGQSGQGAELRSYKPESPMAEA